MKLNLAVIPALIAATAEAHQTLGIHGSGTTNPSKCYWHIMEQMQVQTKRPTQLTYRGVGSSTGQTEFVGEDNLYVPYNDFGSGDIPLDKTRYDALQANGKEMLHLPIMFGAISFFHSVPTGDKQLNLDACTIAKIFKRDITDWNDPAIKNQNPGLELPNPFPITVARRVEGSSSTASITQFLNIACEDEWPADRVKKKLDDWHPDTIGCDGSGLMTNCILETPGTIGYIDAGHGHAEGLQEIELQNKAGNYISSKEAMEKGGIVSATLNSGMPDELDGDFSNVDLLYQVSMSHMYLSDYIS